jgi:hypothetical protein
VDDCSRDSPTPGGGRGTVDIVRILNLANYSSLVTKIDTALLSFIFDLLWMVFWFTCSVALRYESIDPHYDRFLAYFECTHAE